MEAQLEEKNQELLRVKKEQKSVITQSLFITIPVLLRLSSHVHLFLNAVKCWCVCIGKTAREDERGAQQASV